MSNLNPITRLELFLAAAVGEYSGELPAPITRQEQYLKKIIEEIDSGGSVSPEQIDAAIEDYINTHGSDIVSETELSQALSGYATTADMNTALANVGRPTDAQVQTAANNYLENSGIGTMGTMADFKSYVMGE